MAVKLVNGYIWRDFYVGISVSTDLRCTDEHSGSI